MNNAFSTPGVKKYFAFQTPGVGRGLIKQGDFQVKNTLWKFKDNSATFVSKNACDVKTLYFPLCNNYPIMSSLTPRLHGDIKTNYNSFLLEPISRVDLSNSKSSRNFWIYINPKKIWSATGVTKDLETVKNDEFKFEAGLLWQKITRQNKKIGLKAEITSFIPSTGEPVEIMHVNITNISSKEIKFTPTAAIPIFARSANNLHDHRHVTSLLSRIQKNKSGIIVTPTLLFDESEHKKNLTSYFVLGNDDKASPAQYIYSTQEEFTGEASDFEAPEVIMRNLSPDATLNPQGKEPMGALRFKAKALKPKETCAYIVVMGILNPPKDMPESFNNTLEIDSIFAKFNSIDKVINSLNTTKTYWNKISCDNKTTTGDSNFDNWLRWVSIQPTLRKIFGCSFLPDFDYGKGGRGWRDLWQDCLALILNTPGEVRQLLINNFSGVRVDGSNATIIGSKPGEFIADRNNIPRVWMDHGIWPLVTTLLYIHQTSDFSILTQETTYFKDQQICRGKAKDWDWKPEYGKELKTKTNQIYNGTILEHILIQNLVQFFNVGPHNHIRLEGADWNDGFDMAKEFGESVAFTAMYAHNLNSLCGILDKLNEENIAVLKELSILLDSLTAAPINYSNIDQKQKLLDNYFKAVEYEVSGEKIPLPIAQLKSDLKKKAAWITQYIRENEWLKSSYFNGYYDNNKQRVEGKINGLIRMTLTGQVFPVMSGIATDEQTKTLFKACKRYLQHEKLKGFHLNTDFKQEQHALGRAFSFVYGDKENGAFFNHMVVMFSYALYKRGFAKEGYEVLNSIYQMTVNTNKSKIYPCIPEYFNAQGKGMYSYLTGSASWFMLTLITQVFGIRGEYGDLVIEPKLTKQQFSSQDTISLSTSFAEIKIEIKFINPRKKDYGKYSVRNVVLNGKIIAKDAKTPRFIMRRLDFLNLADKPENIIEVTLD